MNINKISTAQPIKQRSVSNQTFSGISNTVAHAQAKKVFVYDQTNKLLSYALENSKGKLKIGELFYDGGKLKDLRLNSKTVHLSYNPSGKANLVEFKNLFTGKLIKTVAFNYKDGKLVSKTFTDFNPAGKPKYILTKDINGKKLEMSYFEYDPTGRILTRSIVDKYQDNGVYIAESTEKFFEANGKVARKITSAQSVSDASKLEIIKDE